MKRKGLTLVEMMVAFTVVGAVSLGVFGASKGAIVGRVVEQDVLAEQQAMALTLTTFSQDVRAAAGLINPTATQFMLKQPIAAGGYRYVSYRLTGTSLQRGTTTTRTGTPADWTNVFDTAMFNVSAGSFSYFLLGNAGGTNATLMRRIEITGFALRSLRTNGNVRTAPISAVMREASNARDLVAACNVRVMGHWPTVGEHRCGDDDWRHYGGHGNDDDDHGHGGSTGDGGNGSGGAHSCYGGHTCSFGDRDDHEDGCGDNDDDWGRDDDGNEHRHDDDCHNHDNGGDEDCWDHDNDHDGEIHIRTCVQNLSGAAVTIASFAGSWHDDANGDKLSMLKLGHGRWGGGRSSLASGAGAQALRGTVTINPGESVPVSMHFHTVPGKITDLSLALYASADTGHANPYWVSIPLP